MLNIQALQVRYGAIEALKGISLHVNEGEIVTIIGGNGAGKSTTMRAISGLERVAGGSVTFQGRDITRMPPHQRVALGIAQSPEGRLIFPDQTVLENLMLGAYHRQVSQQELQVEIERHFTTFPRLKERQHQLAGTLSGGEQQMLAMARALLSHPKLLLLDEPSLGLAPLVVQEIFHVIREVNRTGVTILLVEQMATKALAVAHRGYVLETGRITLEGSGQELLSNPRVMEAYLGKKSHGGERPRAGT